MRKIKLKQENTEKRTSHFSPSTPKQYFNILGLYFAHHHSFVINNEHAVILNFLCFLNLFFNDVCLYLCLHVDRYVHLNLGVFRGVRFPGARVILIVSHLMWVLAPELRSDACEMPTLS